jgi:hypothetical protein
MVYNILGNYARLADHLTNEAIVTHYNSVLNNNINGCLSKMKFVPAKIFLSSYSIVSRDDKILQFNSGDLHG